MARIQAGLVVWWSVAEGRRGRRWREAVADGGGLRHSLLLETDPDGRFTHLELATPSGLLTLHPEADGTLHGNAIEAAGIRHVVGLPWDPDGVVLLDGSPISQAAAVHGPASRRGRGAVEHPVLRLDAQLGLSMTPERLSGLGGGSWRVDRTGETITVDSEGLPLLGAATIWPLELDAE